MDRREWQTSDDPVRMAGWLCPWGKEPRASARRLRLWAVAVARLVEADRHDDRPDIWGNAPNGRRATLAVAERWAETGARPAEANTGWTWMCDDAARAARGVAEAYWGANIGHAPQADKAALLRCVVGDPWRPLVSEAAYQTDPNARAAVKYTAYEALRAAGVEGEEREGAWRRAVESRVVREAHLSPAARALAAACLAGRELPSGRLDPLALLALADALEEGGLPADECGECKGKGQVRRCTAFMYGCAEIGVECECDSWAACEACRGAGRPPHPLLAHLRGGGPHALGCHAIDCVLGRAP